MSNCFRRHFSVLLLWLILAFVRRFVYNIRSSTENLGHSDLLANYIVNSKPYKIVTVLIAIHFSTTDFKILRRSRNL